MTEQTRSDHPESSEPGLAAFSAQQLRIRIRQDARREGGVAFLLGRYEQHLSEAAGGHLGERSQFEAEGKVLALRELLEVLGAYPGDLDDLARYHGYEPLPEM